MINFKIVDIVENPYLDIPPTLVVKLQDGRLCSGEMAAINFLMQSDSPESKAWRSRERIEMR